jgi:hypothetical protein
MNLDWTQKKCQDGEECHQDHLFVSDKDTGRVWASIHGPDEFGHFVMYEDDDDASAGVKYTSSSLAMEAATKYAETESQRPSRDELLKTNMMEVAAHFAPQFMQPPMGGPQMAEDLAGHTLVRCELELVCGKEDCDYREDIIDVCPECSSECRVCVKPASLDAEFDDSGESQHSRPA